MIQAIFFDFYNTLGKFYPPRDKLQSSACANFGINITKKGIDKGYALADAFMASVKSHGPLTDLTDTEREEFFAEYENLILKGAGAKVSKDIAYKIWLRIQKMEYGIILFDDVLPTLDLLNQQGLTLGLISNIGGDIKKSIMIGDSETDSVAAKNANIPFILIKNGYTEKRTDEIHHDHLINNFTDLDKIIKKYIND